MIQGRHTPLDYFFFLRPVLLPPVWTIALLGTLRFGLTMQMPLEMWIAFFLHLTALFGGVYTLNQICDVESDRLNRKLHFLPDGIISISAAWRFTIALDAIALTISAFFGWRYILLTAFIVVLGILYSVGNTPWKNRPWLGLCANAIGHGFAVYLFGFLLTFCPLSEGWLVGIAYTLAVGAVYLVTTVPDAQGDLPTGKRTAAVAWGIKTTTIVALGLVTVAIALAAWSGDHYLAFSGIVAWPFFLRTIIRPSVATSAAKAAVGCLSLAAAIAYPMYIALLVAGFVITRLFFRWRFGMTYPTFV